ncbi:hypothetical protein BC937DRAFT_87714 [Endogone sp. FLAS-F59071]|nr:hypothetical protein BC937DRAFT_87714 [Endogone sp. FLAS-F59071]|eukprot:RUS19293.1 hypothetical protein BC937DRAFT_87714 [Endogone sp. FLAS-F59071]
MNIQQTTSCERYTIRLIGMYIRPTRPMPFSTATYFPAEVALDMIGFQEVWEVQSCLLMRALLPRYWQTNRREQWR